jgi:hypothetical protein
MSSGASYHAAYVAVALIYGGYSVLLWRRARRARARLDDAGTSPRAS